MKFERKFTVAGTPVVDQIEWEVREASIPGAEFHMPAVEVPKGWSRDASNILAQKYLRKAGVPKPISLFPMEEPGMPEWLWRKALDNPMNLSLGSETSARQCFHRMAGCWAYWGWREGYFNRHDCKGREDIPRAKRDEEENAKIFYDELFYMLAMQYAAPNSPQWFNTGLWWAYGIEGPDQEQWTILKDYPVADGDQVANVVDRVFNSYERPQVHACFLTPTTDNLVNPGGIMDTWAREAKIFKQGSGSGVNVSSWRAKGELLSGGGKASGVMSFLRIGDSAAGAIQSGGTTRRAAKMICLDADHPEVEEFVEWKLREEAKAAAMYVGSQVLNNYQSAPTRDPMIAGCRVPTVVLDRMRNGFEPEIFGIGWEGEAIRTVDGQNSNNSVRVTDDFMGRVERGELWELIARTTGEVVKSLPSRDLWLKICRAAWASADPGLLFHTTINAWNTCANDGEIRTTNPCFTGDTKVWTIEGPRRFDELATSGAPITVLTELPDGKLAYRTMENPRITQRSAKVIRITFKAKRGIRGHRISLTELRVTPNHEFFMVDGSRIQAIDLRPGDRIESAYRTVANQKGYITVRATNGDYTMEHHLVAEHDHGRRPAWPAEHGHHVDEVKDRNILGNVEILSASIHNSEYMRGDRNPMRRWYRNASEEERARFHDNMSKATTGANNPNYGNRKIVGRIWITNGEIHRRIYPHDNIPDGWRIGVSKKFGEKRRNANHTVISIEELNETEDVYCGTIPSTGRFFVSLGNDHYEGVLVSNCSEFMHLDGSACDLASLNLCEFVERHPNFGRTRPVVEQFDCDAFEHAVRLWTAVLDISVSMAGFPAREFAEAARDYRTLGLGYANLGGLLAQFGLRYDSDAGRALAASVTALMTGVAYRTSAEIAAELGPFPRWEANATPMQAVLVKHFDEVGKLRVDNLAGDIVVRAYEAWKIPFDSSFRNAQVTLLAPTGTIALCMDCSTTGIEPFYSRSSVKQLAGGGSMAIDRDVLDEDCAVPSRPGGQCLSPEAHVKMVAAVQPFLSGGVSKTINLPHDATVEDVDHVYRLAHRLGLKSVALYRDGSKLTQPLASVSHEDKKEAQRRADDGVPMPVAPNLADQLVRQLAGVQASEIIKARAAGQPVADKPELGLRRGIRRELPSRRPRANRWKLEVGGQSIYISTGDHEDGSLGEVFVTLSREGSDVRSMMESFAKVFSVALQYSTPLDVLVDAFIHTKFEPAGVVAGDTRVRICSSLPDLIVRHLAVEYLGRDDLASVPRVEDAEAVAELAKRIAPELRRATHSTPSMVMLAYACRECGSHGTLRRTGTCVTCSVCGYNEGCG